MSLYLKIISIFIVQIWKVVYSELINITWVWRHIFSSKVKVCKSQWRNFFNDTFVISYYINFKIQIFTQFLVVFEKHIKFLLHYVVAYFVMNGYNEPVFLFNEASVSLFKITVALVIHILPLRIEKPFVHYIFMIESHYLRQYFINWFFSDFFFEITWHLNEAFTDRHDLSHWIFSSIDNNWKILLIFIIWLRPSYQVLFW